MLTPKQEQIINANIPNKSPQDIVKQLYRHGRTLQDITVNLNTEPLYCGIKAIERHEYLRKGEGDLVILAGLPGSGKTMMGWQIASSVAEHGRVLFFSLEMSGESLKKRGLVALSQVPAKKLGLPMFKAKVDAALKKQDLLNMSVVDEGELTINSIMQAAMDEHRTSPLSLIVIDYIGMINTGDELRHAAMGKAAEKLKFELAERIKVPVLVLSQLNSDFEGRYSQYLLAKEKSKFYPDYKPLKNLMRPNLGDLAESKRIGRAADVALFIHRPWLMDKDDNPSNITVFAAKNRHGEAIDFDLEFSRELMYFYDAPNRNEEI